MKIKTNVEIEVSLKEIAVVEFIIIRLLLS